MWTLFAIRSIGAVRSWFAAVSRAPVLTGRARTSGLPARSFGARASWGS
ncbi:hypothetical protein [Nocardiopsis alba]